MKTNLFISSVAGHTAGVGLTLLLLAWIGLTIISAYVDDIKQLKRLISIATFTTFLILSIGLVRVKPNIHYLDDDYPILVVSAIYWGCLLMWGITKLIVFLGNRIERWFDKNVSPKLKEKAGYEHKKRFARFVIKPYKTPFGERGGYNLSGYVARETRIYWYIDTETRGLVKIRKKYIGKDRYPVESIEVTNAILSS